jgi:integrase
VTVDRAGWKRVKRKTIEVYRIAFSYRGAECRETIVLPHTKSNDNYVSRLRAEILGRIARNDFSYAEFFPESSRAGEFGRGSARGVKTIGDALDAWILRNKTTLEPSTWIAYNNAVTHKLKPFFGAMKPAALLVSDIREWVGLQTTSLKTISNVLLPLRAVLDELVEDGAIKTNPLRAVKLAKLVPVVKRTSAFAPDPFTWEELTKVLLALDPVNLGVFLFWAHTGVRTGELIGLRWQRVDMAARTASIQETTTIGQDKDRPKTKSGVRTIKLLPAAWQALVLEVPLCKRADEMEPGARVFRNPKSRSEGGAWGYCALADTWRAACAKAGVRYRNPYQLRHTFASQLLSEGRPTAEIAALLGHKTIEMVIRAYGRWIGGQPTRLHGWGQMLLQPEGWKAAA